MFMISRYFSAKWWLRELHSFQSVAPPSLTFGLQGHCAQVYMHQAREERMWRISVERFSWAKPGSDTNYLKGNWKMWSRYVSKKRKERDSDERIAGSDSPDIHDSPHSGLHLSFKLDLSKLIPFTFQTWYHFPGMVISQLFCSNNQSPDLSGLQQQRFISDLFLRRLWAGCSSALWVFWFQDPGRRNKSPMESAHSSDRRTRKMETHMLKHGMSHIYSHPIGQNMKHNQVQSQRNEIHTQEILQVTWQCARK